MTIQEKTKSALARLCPAASMPAPPEPESDRDGGEAEPPRANGLIEHDYAARGFHLDLQLDPDQLVDAARILFDLGYFLEAITGVDWITDDQFEVVYDFSRYDFDLCRTVIRTRIPRAEPQVPTITPVYTGASWHERETHDFFGIVFTGHPHLVPLLLPEDADFHPLRKDFKP